MAGCLARPRKVSPLIATFARSQFGFSQLLGGGFGDFIGGNFEPFGAEPALDILLGETAVQGKANL